MKSKSITIIQISRFGDLLQTYWSIKKVKRLNPTLELNLVAREKFAKPLFFLLSQVFTNICYLNSEQMISNTSFDGLNKFIDKINSWESDVLVNLSFSKTSALLSTLVDSKFKLGLTIDQYGKNRLNGPWSEYLYSTVMSGNLNPFSLVDIFRFIIGSEEKPDIDERKVSGNSIIIHPFASQDRKSWSPSKWTEIILKVIKRNPQLTVIIVGSIQDAQKGKLIIDHPLLSHYGDRLKLECGTYSLEDLSKLLSQSILFCGHDSMVGHMASITCVQSLTISLGSVRPIESTPYGINNYVLSPRTDCFPCFPDTQCSEYKCHKDLSYQLVSECIQQLLDSMSVNFQEVQIKISPLHLSNANLAVSSISKTGLFTLKEISQNRPNLDEIYRSFYKIAWLFMLEGVEETLNYPKLDKSTSSQLETSASIFKQLFELSEFGKKYSRFILEEVQKNKPNLNTIKEHGRKIEEIDKLQSLLSNHNPLIKPIVNFYNLKKSKMKGDDLIQLCTNSYHIYESTSSFCNVMYDLIVKTLNEYHLKNRANHSNNSGVTHD